MISKQKYKKLTWIDIESPTQKEVNQLMKDYDVPPLVTKELLSKTLRSKVDLYDNLIYLILHFPTVDHKHDKVVEKEIDFILGKNFLITVHYEFINSLHEFSKVFEVSSILDKGNIGNHAGFLFFHIVTNLYNNSANELETVDLVLKKIEEDIFKGKEGKMVKAISDVNHKLLDFKQALRFHNDVLRSFEIAGEFFFGKKFSYHLRAITGEYNKVSNILESHKELLDDLQETNDSLLSSKTNETIKILTIMTFIILPLSLIAGIFGMNANFNFIKGPSDFYIIIGIMAFMALIMFVYFKLKKWL